MIGLKRETVKVIEYQQKWGLVFEQTKKEIIQSITNEKLEIEHIGSTSIENLASKPIIDILIGIENLTDESINRIIPKMKEISIEYRGNREEAGGHLFIKKLENEIITHHIHVVKKDDKQWKNYLKFRDKLRENVALRIEYEKLKLSLAKKYPDNRKLYTKSKAEFIKRIIET